MKLVDDKAKVEQANDDIRRAQYAKSAMDNPVVREYFVISKAALYERIEKTKPRDTEEREQIYLELQQFNRFEKNFERAMLNGKVAETFLQKLNQRVKGALKR